MNAAIRAIVRSGVDRGWEVMGIRNGYAGLIRGEIVELGRRDVSGIVQLGGTMLGSARCREFETPEGQAKALDRLGLRDIEALVVIGGNGSQTGAHALASRGFPVVGVASTIDNDLFGSDITIGVDTALNIALEAIDRLKVTATSHHRTFLVEVMGRHCGYLALMAGIAGGAEAIVVPERSTDPDALVRMVRSAYEWGKRHALIVIAEGAHYNAARLAEYFRQQHTLDVDVRVTILGHVQRGGTPGAFDRILATRLGAGAVAALERGEFGVLVGFACGEIRTTPLDTVVQGKKALDPAMLDLAEILAK